VSLLFHILESILSVVLTCARYFAGEIIGNLLDVEPRRWRHPRRMDFSRNKERVAGFKKRFDRFDWTGLIERSGR
jgi:hypothetical protein